VQTMGQIYLLFLEMNIENTAKLRRRPTFRAALLLAFLQLGTRDRTSETSSIRSI
jgi:hypothetical protein